jgi:phosphatidate phosphatase APP1
MSSTHRIQYAVHTTALPASGGCLKPEEIAKVPRGPSNGEREIGYISDLDETLIPEHEKGKPDPAPYPAVVALYQELEHGDDGDGKPGDAHYVTARPPTRVKHLRDEYFPEYGVPDGEIETRPALNPDVKCEKVRDVAKILVKNPRQDFILFGDSTQRDPEVYREVKRLFPERVKAIIIHNARGDKTPSRFEGMHLVDDYVEAAEVLHAEGVLTEKQVQRVKDSMQ